MTTMYCAICGNRFKPDDDHVRVEAEHVRIDDCNDVEDYVFHPRWWQRLSEECMEPA